jgi:hypothetical protein
MATWPDTAELAQVLNVDNVSDWQTTLDRVLAAAIRKVKSDVGLWDDNVDEPDDSLAQAALRMAELMATRPDAAVGRFVSAPATTSDPTYLRLLSGHRRRFGIA